MRIGVKSYLYAAGFLGVGFSLSCGSSEQVGHESQSGQAPPATSATTPPPTSACGNGTCDLTESCKTCPSDCQPPADGSLAAKTTSQGLAPSGNMLIHFLGAPLFNYKVEASTDLHQWTKVADVVAAGDGTFSFEDLNTHSFAMRFYRAAPACAAAPPPCTSDTQCRNMPDLCGVQCQCVGAALTAPLRICAHPIACTDPCQGKTAFCEQTSGTCQTR